MKIVEMTWPEIQRAAQNENTVAVLPIAAIEQHGPHLAVSTDDAIATALAERVEKSSPLDILLCPTLAVGSSHHHKGFFALSFSPETYVNVLIDLVESLLESGFSRIVLLNAHGGNVVPAKQALNILSHRHQKLPHHIALATYWEMCGAIFAGEAPMESTSISHADEYETSMMLHLFPKRVHRERAVPSSFAPSNYYINCQNEKLPRGVSMSKSFHLILSNGSNGSPQLASAAKGEHLMERGVEEVATFLKDFSTWPFLEDLREEIGAGTC